MEGEPCDSPDSENVTVATSVVTAAMEGEPCDSPDVSATFSATFGISAAMEGSLATPRTSVQRC